ncbi:putative lipid II flippase FtsW [soil metagenome]
MTGSRPMRPLGPPGGVTTGPFVMLLVLIVVMNLIGLLMVLSASSVTALHDNGSSWYYVKRQAMWVGLGALVLLGAMRLDLDRVRRLAKPFLLGSIGLLVLVLVPGVGVTVNGSSRWLGVGALQFQPSEFAKLALLLFTAGLLTRRADRMDDTGLTLRPVLFLLSVVALLLLVQPNLGTTIVTAAIVFTMLFVAGAPLASLAGYGVVAVTAAVGLALAADYRRARVMAFLDPWADPGNTGYQVIQSMVGLADGGIGGAGLGASRAKWGFLPYAHTDFIFSIIGEELGLIGTLLVVLLFCALGVLGIRTALAAENRFGMLIAVGITAWFMIQAFVNIGAVIGMLPITGVPLPFISFGGSSLLVSMGAAGLLLHVARHPRPVGSGRHRSRPAPARSTGAR